MQNITYMVNEIWISRLIKFLQFCSMWLVKVKNRMSLNHYNISSIAQTFKNVQAANRSRQCRHPNFYHHYQPKFRLNFQNIYKWLSCDCKVATPNILAKSNLEYTECKSKVVNIQKFHAKCVLFPYEKFHCCQKTNTFLVM